MDLRHPRKKIINFANQKNDIDQIASLEGCIRIIVLKTGKN